MTRDLGVEFIAEFMQVYKNYLAEQRTPFDSETVRGLILYAAERTLKLVPLVPEPQIPDPGIVPPMWIGLCGKVGAGKTTLGKLIGEHLYSEWTLVPFANELKLRVLQMLYTQTGRDLANTGEWEAIQGYLEGNWKEDVYRPILQGFGEYMRRIEYPEYWLNLVERKVAAHPNRTHITDDVRHELEGRAIVQHSRGLLIYVPGGLLEESLSFPHHASEKDFHQIVEMVHTVAPASQKLREQWVIDVLPSIIRERLLPAQAEKVAP